MASAGNQLEILITGVILMPEYLKSIFIFRRDLRLRDNRGLLAACHNSKKVIPMFIFTPEQLKNNKYKSDNCVQFMMASLKDLDANLRKKGSRLFYFYGSPDDIIRRLLNADKNIEAVYVNMDYTPYSVARDAKIEKVCVEKQVAFESYEDVLLYPVETIITGSGGVYNKFTPFYNRARQQRVTPTDMSNPSNFVFKNIRITGEFHGDMHQFYTHNDNIMVEGGRDNALGILRQIGKFKKYNRLRNDLMTPTTRLSAYIKFGCVSIREVYEAFKSKLGMRNDLIKQLYWRDFYYNVAYDNPHTFGRYGALKEKYNKIKWENNRGWYKKWCDGRTGFPVVDACMTELNTTGFMHNRGRLITSAFLVKLLLIDWNWGERYFAQKLVDYDPSINLGNWSWSAGVGADSQPYFRIFNPWLQSAKHDPNAEYIKHWLPELADVKIQHLHQWDKYYDEYPDVDYPKPMIDYVKQKDKALKMYKKVFR